VAIFGLFFWLLTLAYLALHGTVAIGFLVLLAGLVRWSAVSRYVRWLAVPFALLDLIAAAIDLALGNPYSDNVLVIAMARMGRIELIALGIVVTLAVRKGKKVVAPEDAAEDDPGNARDSTTRSAASRLRTAVVLGLFGLMTWVLLRAADPPRIVHEETDDDGVNRRLVVEELPKGAPMCRVKVCEASPPLEDSVGNVDSAALEWAWTQLGSEVDLDTGHGHIRPHPDRLLAQELEALTPGPESVGQVSKLALVTSRAQVLSTVASVTSLSPAAIDAIFQATEPEGALFAAMPSGRSPGGAKDAAGDGWRWNAARLRVLEALAGRSDLGPARTDAILAKTGEYVAPSVLIRLAERGDASTEAILAAASICAHFTFEARYADVLCALARARGRTDAAPIAAALERQPGSSSSDHTYTASMVLVELAHQGTPTDTILSSVATVDSTVELTPWTYVAPPYHVSLRSLVLQALVRPERLAGLPVPEADRIAAAARDGDGPVLVALIGHASRAALEKAAGALGPSERKTVLDALAGRSPR
jgi:hypothetical protein